MVACGSRINQDQDRLNAMHPACFTADELAAQCVIRADRRSGPGGQHRNKVQTAIVVTHTPTGLAAEASERRSQVDNRRNAIFRLRLTLAVQFREPVDAAQLASQLPSELWRQRARGSRISVSVEHDDYPAILAELLDVLQATEFDMQTASQYFGVTPSQLVRLIRVHAPAMSFVNQQRLARGEHRLT